MNLVFMSILTSPLKQYLLFQMRKGDTHACRTPNAYVQVVYSAEPDYHKVGHLFV